MRTSKTRHQFYLPGALSEKLDTLAAQPGGPKAAILSNALTVWRDRHGATKTDPRCGPRFDRLMRAHESHEAKFDLVIETLGVFMQHQRPLVVHQPPIDAASGQLGIERCRRFTDLVARRLATNFAVKADVFSKRSR